MTVLGFGNYLVVTQSMLRGVAGGGQGLRGSVTSLAWTNIDGDDILIVGTAGGYLCLWRRPKDASRSLLGLHLYSNVEPQRTAFRVVSSEQIANNIEITGIDAVSGATGRTVIVTSFVNGLVKLWDVDADLHMVMTASNLLNADHGLSSVRFSGDGSQVRAFSLLGGDV